MKKVTKIVLFSMVCCLFCPQLFSMYSAVEPFVLSREQQSLQQILERLQDQLRILTLQDDSRMTVDQKRLYLTQKNILLKMMLDNILKQIKEVETRSLPESYMTKEQLRGKRLEKKRLYGMFFPMNNERVLIEDELTRMVLATPVAAPVALAPAAPEIATPVTTIPAPVAPASRRGLFDFIGDWWSGSKRK